MIGESHAPDAAVAVLRRAVPALAPKLAVVLGSGWGAFADEVSGAIRVPYADLPGFPAAGVAGHAGEVVAGRIGAIEVLLLQGRSHYYEHGHADAMALPLRCCRALGVEIMLMTNAAGSLDARMPPGSLMAISDHINLVGRSPLFGWPDATRFVDMVDAYDPYLRRRLQRTAEDEKIVLHEGVYVWFAGPQFETPAEIRAAKVLGADAVGMSTVPEVIVARHAGMRVAALSLITNMAAGLGNEVLTHEHTLRTAAEAIGRARRLIAGFIRNLANDQ